MFGRITPLGSWCRVGDYSVTNYGGSHSVSFVPDSAVSIISRIHFRYSKSGFKPGDPFKNNIELAFSPLYAREIARICDKLSLKYRCSTEFFDQYTGSSSSYRKNLSASIYTLEMVLDKKNMALLMKLFKHFNQELQPHPFPKELLDEIKNIYQTGMQSSFSEHKHIIPVKKRYDISYGTKFQRSVYSAFSSSLANESNPQLYKIYLLEGHSPQYMELLGDTFTPITYAVLRHASLEPLEILLWYKTEPFMRSIATVACGMYTFSAYELSYAFSQFDKLDLMVNECSRLSRQSLSLTNTRPNPQVINSGSVLTDDGICSYFHFDNQHSISTRLIDVSNLTHKERESLFELFKQNFAEVDDLPEHELKRIFERDFSGNKSIDLIYDGSRMIGFNLFEIVNPVHHKFVSMVHCAYAAIAPEYRGLGLMLFLAFRRVYVEQLNHPERQVGLYFSALHYNSYRLVLDFKHYPKFQSEVMNSIINDILDTICPSNYRYHHLLTNYIVDSLRVRELRADRHEPSLNERIFSREILGLDAKQRQKIKNRAGTVAFIVGDENTLFTRNAARQLGIDFERHIAEYAQLLQPASGANHTSVTNFSVFMRRSDALFSPAATAADTNRPFKSPTKL